MKLRNRKITVLIILFQMLPGLAYAQKYAVSTNVVDCAFLGTMNLDVSASVARRLSFTAGVKYNPWEFHMSDPDVIVRNQMTAFSAGVCYWPWHVYSGWWVSLKGQYKEYSRAGIWRPALEDGKAIGCVLSAGYSLMLSRHVNVEFGLGGWAGRLMEYTLYCCPRCMDIREKGPRNFGSFDDMYISFSYVF